MKFEVSIPFQSLIRVAEDHIEVVGSRALLEKVRDLQKSQGAAIAEWPLTPSPKTAEEILLNELIRKAKGEAFVYSHDELCHCRMVPTETVKNAIKAGCRQVSELSRTTLAGTGCGSCRPDIEKVIAALTA